MGNVGLSKIRPSLQCYEILWIYNIDKICNRAVLYVSLEAMFHSFFSRALGLNVMSQSRYCCPIDKKYLLSTRLGRKGHNPHELPFGNHYDFWKGLPLGHPASPMGPFKILSAWTLDEKCIFIFCFLSKIFFLQFSIKIYINIYSKIF